MARPHKRARIPAGGVHAICDVEEQTLGQGRCKLER